MDLRLQLVSVPVADVDRAKAFYVDQVGLGVGQDVQVDENHRFVELMPAGSLCSIALTTGYIDSEPGCLKGVQLNVKNVDEVHAFLRDRDVEVSEIQDHPPFLLLLRPRWLRLVNPRSAASGVGPMSETSNHLRGGGCLTAGCHTPID